jgi:glycosyltransferase involved in cell wall biosynthesis
MRILVIADPKLPIPPLHYGGAERTIAYLCAELQERGHEVDLIAGPGSQSYGGDLITHHLPGPGLPDRAYRKLLFQFRSLPALRRADVILNFGRLDYLETALRLRTPILCCFQNPVTQAEVDWVLRRRHEKVAFVGVSHAQVAGITPADHVSVVHNATDVNRLRFSPEPGGEPYLAFLGRITANKGADTAIRVARRTGMKLRMGGTISDEPGDREFFEEQIRPQLDEQIQWIGPVDDEAKQRLLGEAIALLFPIRWQEPFGIVMAESLASGTPVIALRCASTPEVIADGVTGFLCDSEDELVGAVARVSTIDRSACRRSAESHFSTRAMAEGYLRAIETLLAGAGSNGI